jgi:hypothetical protein
MPSRKKKASGPFENAADDGAMRCSSSLWLRAVAVAGALALTTWVTIASMPAADASPPTGHGAIIENSGCAQNSFIPVDDATHNFALPFSVNWFGVSYNSLWVNSNGGVNLARSWSAYSGLDLRSIHEPVIAPLFTDLDTRNPATSVETYGMIANYGGHRAFCANWVKVGHFSWTAPEYSAQLLIVDRSDTGAGNVDVIFNYDWIADSNSPVTVGYGAADGTSYEFPGSGSAPTVLSDSNPSTSLVNNTLNSGGQLGRYTFRVRGGYPPKAQTITFDNPGDQTVGTTLPLRATASSGLAVAYTATGACHATGSNLFNDAAGSCSVTAHQAGNLDGAPAWNPAPNVAVSFAVKPAPLSISGAATRGLAGHAYTFRPTRTGGTSPFTWSVASGSLPTGLRLDATTGTVHGTPMSAGVSNAVLQVADALGVTATHSVVFNVDARYGYRLAGRDGGVFAFGASPFAGSLAGHRLKASIVGIASPTNASGHFLVGSDGGVFALGGARYQGSLAGRRLRAPVVGIATTSDGRGYWLATADGSVYPFGTAKPYGHVTTNPRRSPVVGIAATPDGNGYWLATRAGALYGFGRARTTAHVGATNKSAVVGVASTPSGHGAWLVNSRGDVFGFGDAPSLGSLSPSVRRALHVPVVGITAAPAGGYWLVASNSAVFSFGRAPFLGNAGDLRLHAPIVGIAAGW